MDTTTSLKIIDEICQEKNIDVKLLSFGWIRELKKDGKIRHIVRNSFDLNPAAATDIVNDKYATYEVLKQNNIETIEHVMLFNPITRKEFAKNLEIQVEDVLKRFNGKVVIKANNSSKGQDVFLLDNKQDIIQKVEQLFLKGADGVSACPFKEIKVEYRVVFLDGNIEFIYKKEKPYILGDGKSTIKQLLKSICVDSDIDKNLDLEYIPKENEKVIISWKHNLSLGAIPKQVTENDKYIEIVKEIALDAAKATNVRFASIDVSQGEDNDIFIMEINGSVCMSKFAENVENGKEIIKKIYSKAIDKMFE